MSPLQIITFGAVALLVIVFLAVLYLNSIRNTTTEKLIRYVEPFDLAFSSLKKNTYASGYVDGKWVVFNIQHKGRGDALRMRMRTLLDFPLEAKFYFATSKSRNYLVKLGSQDARNWAKMGERYYFQALAPTPQAAEFQQALSPATRSLIDEFDTQYDGIVLYDMDGELFGKYDHLIIEGYPELDEQTVLFTHVVLNDKLDSLDFQKFVRDSVGLAKAIEEDMKNIFPNWKPATVPSLGGNISSLKVKPTKTKYL